MYENDIGDYREEDWLQISGLQHFLFCRRQWALIHIEQQWQENYWTVDGSIFHEHAHDSNFIEKRGDLLIVRALPVASATLGVSGKCDVVEFYADGNGIALHNWEGFWRPCPIEYKRGHAKIENADCVQLCCQAMCLEEMLGCSIDLGYLYYGQMKRREKVVFDKELRQQTMDALQEMHLLFKKQYTPKGKKGKHCDSCSLKEICLPKMRSNLSVKKYVDEYIEGDLV